MNRKRSPHFENIIPAGLRGGTDGAVVVMTEQKPAQGVDQPAHVHLNLLARHQDLLTDPAASQIIVCLVQHLLGYLASEEGLQSGVEGLVLGLAVLGHMLPIHFHKGFKLQLGFSEQDYHA